MSIQREFPKLLAPEQCEVTDRLKKCGEMLGIQVIDHIVVGDNRAVSLQEC